jgi:hypothetical protein
MNTQYTYNTEEQIETDVLDMLGEQFNLIVWNDDINTLDIVNGYS